MYRSFGRGAIVLMAVLSCAILVPPVFGKDQAKSEVGRIRKDYQKIVAELTSYRKVEARWEAGPQSPGIGITYTGYYDRANKLVLLKYHQGEEGYWSEYEYYFRDGEVFFLFIHSGNPDGSEKEERIYFAGSVIVQALLREKAADDNRKIGELENKRYDSIMDTIDASSRTYRLGAEQNLNQFRTAIKKN